MLDVSGQDKESFRFYSLQNLIEISTLRRSSKPHERIPCCSPDPSPSIEILWIDAADDEEFGFGGAGPDARPDQGRVADS